MIDFSKLDPNETIPDNGETVQISSLALLKMLRHGKAGIPLEVMGLLMGKFINEYCIQIVDVYSMPQTGTGVTVEAVDPVYQALMTHNLSLVNKNEDIVGWYHSHPGFGPWLSSTDMSTQESFERLNKRAVAIVVDPIQSVKNFVVLDCFRLINNQFLITGIEPRVVTSNLGFLVKPSVVALLHGLNRHYYCFRILYKKKKLEQKMLLNMNRKKWEKVLVYGREKKEENLKDAVNRYMGDKKNSKSVGLHRKELLEVSSRVYDRSVINNLLKTIHRRIFSQ